MIGCVGIVLSFKAKTCVLNERKSALSDYRAVKEVSCVKLNARKIRINLELSAADRLINNRVRFTLNIGANYTIKWLTLSLDTYNITNDHSFQGGGFSVPNLTPGFSCIGRVKCKF